MADRTATNETALSLPILRRGHPAPVMDYDGSFECTLAPKWRLRTLGLCSVEPRQLMCVSQRTTQEEASVTAPSGITSAE